MFNSVLRVKAAETKVKHKTVKVTMDNNGKNAMSAPPGPLPSRTCPKQLFQPPQLARAAALNSALIEHLISKAEPATLWRKSIHTVA